MKTKFAENFKLLRKEKGITQEKLAERLNVSAQSVSRWELGICYPDLELITAIANYFGVSTDILLLNDVDSKAKDKEEFYEKLRELKYGSSEILEFSRKYKEKYPSDPEYASIFVHEAVGCVLNGLESKKLIAEIESTVCELRNTEFWNSALIEIIKICDESELQKWLELCPYTSTQNRRGALVTRALCHGDDKQMHIQQSLEAFEKYAVQLERRFPDSFGPVRKAEYHKRILRIIENFGDGANPPDAWKLFYAYKQLVLAACLFGLGDRESGIKEFNSAIEKYKYIFENDCEYLTAGGEIFANLKVDKRWSKAIDEDGNEYKLYAIMNYSFYFKDFLYYFLTNKRWAWFDSVRDTPEFSEAVSWAKELMDGAE